MEMIFFLLALGVFSVLRKMPEEKRAELLLRIEHKLHECGFIDYPGN